MNSLGLRKIVQDAEEAVKVLTSYETLARLILLLAQAVVQLNEEVADAKRER